MIKIMSHRLIRYERKNLLKKFATVTIAIYYEENIIPFIPLFNAYEIVLCLIIFVLRNSSNILDSLVSY